MLRSIVFIIFLGVSCRETSQQVATSKDFLNHVIVSDSIYSKDSTEIIADLYIKMKNHEASFSNPEYFDSTVLVIDTIIYDPSLKKIAAFVIAKNPSYRNPHMEPEMPFYYNASCYLGKRIIPDSSRFELKDTGPFSLVNFDDQEGIRRAMRDYFFLELATVLDDKGQPAFKYNLDDKRFWESSTGWERAFE